MDEPVLPHEHTFGSHLFVTKAVEHDVIGRVLTLSREEGFRGVGQSALLREAAKARAVWERIQSEIR